MGYLGVLATTNMLINRIAQNETEKLIGPCEVELKSLEKRDANTVTVNFKISGCSDKTEDVPYYKIIYYNEVEGQPVLPAHTYKGQKATNGDFSINIDNLHGGKYVFQVFLYPSRFERFLFFPQFYCKKSEAKSISLIPMYISDILKDVAYSTENKLIRYDLDVSIGYYSDNDRELAKHIKDYGICLKVDDGINKKVQYFSAKEKDIANVIVELPREDFIVDKNSLTAKCADKISLCVYTLDWYDIRQFYEESPLDLNYNEKPQVSTGGCSAVKATSATIECDYKHFLFWKGSCGVEISGKGKTNNILKDFQTEGLNKVMITNLEANTTYTYRGFIEVSGNRIYGESRQFTTKKKEDDGPTQGLWIDLGLPSGVKWASHNVGASSPEGYGSYFAWGETSPKAEYYDENSLTYGKLMGDISGNPQYDAAAANWGGGARMPTEAECSELQTDCTSVWTTQNGVNGRLLTGPNGNSIFLPYAGEYGDYWSSTPDGDDDHFHAWSLDLSSGNFGCHCDFRDVGHSVRPVRD